MRYLTVQMVADAINRAPSPRFDTHEVEKNALGLHPVETAQEIVAQANSGDPLKHFGAALSRWIDRTFGNSNGQIRKTNKVRSMNLSGSVSSNQQWEKMVEIIAAPASPQLDEAQGELDVEETPALRRGLTDVIREIAADQRTRGFPGRTAEEMLIDDEASLDEDAARDRELEAARRHTSAEVR